MFKWLVRGALQFRFYIRLLEHRLSGDKTITKGPVAVRGRRDEEMGLTHNRHPSKSIAVHSSEEY